MPARTLAALKQKTASFVFAALTLSVLPATAVGLYRGLTADSEPFLGLVIGSCIALGIIVLIFLATPTEKRPLIVCVSAMAAALSSILVYGEPGEGTTYALICVALATFYYGSRAGAAVLCACFAALSTVFHAMRLPVVSALGFAPELGEPQTWLIPIFELVIPGPLLIWGTARFSDRIKKALFPTTRPALYWELPTGDISAFDIWEELDQPIFVVDTDMRIYACNPAAGRLLEVPEADLVGKHTYEFTFPGTPYALPLKWDKAMDRSSVLRSHLVTLRTQSGRAVVADVKLREIPGSGGDVRHLIFLIHDRTADNDLEHQRHFNSLLWQQSGVAIATFDSETRFVAVNPGMESMLGYTSQELMGRAAQEMVYDQTLIVGSAEPFQERVKTADPSTPAVLRHKNGSSVCAFVRVYPIRGPVDPRVAFIGLAMNVSEQQSLRARSNTLSAIWNRLSERVAIVGPDDTVLSCNRAFADFIGRSSDAVEKLPLHDVGRPFESEWLKQGIARARKGESFSPDCHRCHFVTYRRTCAASHRGAVRAIAEFCSRCRDLDRR